MNDKIKWITQNQQMTFVDSNGYAVNPWALTSNSDYEVYITLGNTGQTAFKNIVVNVVHSAFGIGLPGGNNDGVLPSQPIQLDFLPPTYTASPGSATLSFKYHTPAGGHSCLTATVISIDGVTQNGPLLSQNTTINSAPVGVPASFSFTVYGDPVYADQNKLEQINLTLAEKFDDGTSVPANQSWNPLLMIPAGILKAGNTSPVTKASPVDLALPTDAFYSYSIGLQVTVQSGATVPHVFHIEGLVGGISVGVVDIRVVPDAVYVKPNPYVNGGYQSADVILTDQTTGIDVPIGGLPGSSVWDTLLKPNTPYDFSAIVHNGPTADAVNTVVRFWSFPSGAGSNGTLVDIQSVTVPVNGQVRVRSAKPFISAPSGQHICAVISIYNAESGNCPDATTAAQVPDPLHDIIHSCSAWRNTDSLIVIPNHPWKFPLGVQWPPIHVPGPDPGPIHIEIVSQHVPLGWQRSAEVKQLESNLREAGGIVGKPLFLLSEFRSKFKSANLNIKLTLADKKVLIKTSEKNAGAFLLHAPVGKAANFVVSGKIPDIAKQGDIYLVQVTARYPSWGKNSPPRDIQFLEVLHVGKE